ncbi:MAG: hypothetical protein KVP17_003265, partial [Porospora cf. gigantea B]
MKPLAGQPEIGYDAINDLLTSLLHTNPAPIDGGLREKLLTLVGLNHRLLSDEGDLNEPIETLNHLIQSANISAGDQELETLATMLPVARMPTLNPTFHSILLKWIKTLFHAPTGKSRVSFSDDGSEGYDHFNSGNLAGPSRDEQNIDLLTDLYIKPTNVDVAMLQTLLSNLLEMSRRSLAETNEDVQTEGFDVEGNSELVDRDTQDLNLTASINIKPTDVDLAILQTLLGLFSPAVSEPADSGSGI